MADNSKKRARAPSILPGAPPMKRLIICADGSWQTASHGYRHVPSNVARMSRVIPPWGVSYETADGRPSGPTPCPQVVFYDAGVGTGLPDLDKKSLLFGRGLNEHVCHAYNFIVNNYSPGDELYFFGFSRGAFTVRAVAGLVANVGICTRIGMNRYWEMWKAYKSRGEQPIEYTQWARKGLAHVCDECARNGHTTCEPDGLPAPWGCAACRAAGIDCSFRTNGGLAWLNSCHSRVKIKVVGAWDTVAALGLPENSWIDVHSLNKEHGFHDTALHPEIQNAFHALALDEHRKPFKPAMWYLPQHQTKTNLVQCWFPGTHDNIGGGAKDSLKGRHGDLESTATLTLCWMIDRVQETTDLTFDFDSLLDVMQTYRSNLREALSRSKITRATRSTSPNNGRWLIKPDPEQDSESHSDSAWGMQAIIDSFTGLQSLPGSEWRRPGRYCEPEGPPTALADMTAEPIRHNTNEYLHPCVYHAQVRAGYTSAPLEGWYRDSSYSADASGRMWRKNVQIQKKATNKKQSPWRLRLGSRSDASSGDSTFSFEEREYTMKEFVIPITLGPRQKKSMERWLMLAADEIAEEQRQTNNASDRAVVEVPPPPPVEFPWIGVQSISLQEAPGGRKVPGPTEEFLKMLDEENGYFIEGSYYKTPNAASPLSPYPFNVVQEQISLVVKHDKSACNVRAVC